MNMNFIKFKKFNFKLVITNTLLLSLCLLISYPISAANNESSGGIIISLFQPDYGKFATIASTAGQPKFESQMLLVGGDATFMRKGFFTGGRVLYGNTSTSSISTSASTYEIANIGLKTGYGIDLSIIDIKLGSYFGIGNLHFSSVTTSTSGTIWVDYLFIEPFAMIGIAGGKNFAASFGAGYHYAFPYKVTTYGSTLLSDPTQASVGGINIMFELSFGDFSH
ncbi:hypothetical protein [Fluviispira multicolorata]|uniref:Outer membrane protein beta-barrel domain-containing protein n=1 Tax=Fluviispira multicolorata TaxID=2654512 RepID=A0A833JD32_9BACT|nr:hypothetical protein [Fluviispira multicolorata]KAB8031038.1 hypothetical protein GCL57_08715 [Fluviispira multicolorata]